MRLPRLFLLLALGVHFCSRINAFGPAFDFSKKSDDELLQLLKSEDPRKRCSAAAYLGDRFGDPRAIIVDGPIQVRRPADTKLPQNILTAFEHLLKNDPNESVRMCVVRALERLRFKTNTVPLIASALDDRNAYVRIHAFNALIEIAQSYKEPTHPRAVPTIRSSLADSNTEVQWQAAFAATRLGTNAISLTMDLRKLTNSPSRKVRGYAERALQAIQRPQKSE